MLGLDYLDLLQLRYSSSLFSFWETLPVLRLEIRIALLLSSTLTRRFAKSSHISQDIILLLGHLDRFCTTTTRDLVRLRDSRDTTGCLSQACRNCISLPAEQSNAGLFSKDTPDRESFSHLPQHIRGSFYLALSTVHLPPSSHLIPGISL